jgi:hypothetical protein
VLPAKLKPGAELFRVGPTPVMVRVVELSNRA